MAEVAAEAGRILQQTSALSREFAAARAERQRRRELDPADFARLFHAVLPSKDECTRWGWQVWRVEELKELIRIIQEAAPSGSSAAALLGLSDRL